MVEESKPNKWRYCVSTMQELRLVEISRAQKKGICERKLNELEMKSKNNNIRDLYRRINNLGSVINL
jgi:hypothetical protein